MRLREFISDFDASTGKYNAITDVDGVSVGQVQFWKDDPFIQRTGATVILPHKGDVFSEGVLASTDVLNGFGVLTGRDAVDELGFLSSPIVLTNTRSIGSGYEAVMQFFLERGLENADLPLPVVGECDDSYLNDSKGSPVPLELFKEAIKSAKSGVVEEGGVGAGTGMELFGFKGGIGTSSRVVETGNSLYTVGVLVNANYGRRNQLSILGRRYAQLDQPEGIQDGSCIGVLAADAPIPPRLLKRLAKRMGLGLGRTGSVGNNSSGEIFLAFSTENRISVDLESMDSGHFMETVSKSKNADFLSNEFITSLFDAAVSATEEAALNALFQGKTTKGYAGHVLEGFPARDYFYRKNNHG